MTHILKDSGKRQEFTTGAVRDLGEGKGRYDLISPLALKRLALVHEKGAIKYGDHNWEKGIPIKRCLESGIRHAYQYLEGLRDEDHLAQAMWNFAAAIHIEEMIKRGRLPGELDDLPDYLPKQE